MIIDWKAAPEGTTHGMTVGLGEMRWYRVGGHVECWSVTIGWTQSFFLSKEEFEAAGLRLYEHGEQSELVMLREQRDALLQSLKDLRQELMVTLQENDIDPNYYLAIALSSSGRKAFVDSGRLITDVEGTK